MAETRINLRHLLENLRDSYPFSIEEAILTELIANSLDSRASVIRIDVSKQTGTLRIVDNGAGMDRTDFRQYHDIAASSKIRGRGIGFAGVGSKLALLVCEHVDTETRRGKIHLQSRWRLLKADRARWESCDPGGEVAAETGTAVTLQFKKPETPLLNPDRVHDYIQKHFAPLLDSFFHPMLRTVYPSRVTISLNGASLQIEAFRAATAIETFMVRIPPGYKIAGIGFVSLNSEPLPEEIQGIAVSTYGKVIKRGWDWLSLAPRRPERITGLVEIPALASILTLNKADFLRTPSTLQKYYRYRSAVQRSVQPILENFGEVERRQPASQLSQPLERELEAVLANIIPDFPELEPLVGTKTRGGMRVPVSLPVGAANSAERSLGSPDKDSPRSQHESPASGTDSESPKTSQKRPGLQIGFDDKPDQPDLAWISGNTVWINRAHPAFLRNQRSSAQSFHVALALALVLSRHLLGDRSPQQFVSEFLAQWGKAGQHADLPLLRATADVKPP